MTIRTLKSSITAPATGIFISVILLLMQSKNPGLAIPDFILGSFTSVYYFGTLINTAALFIIAGAGAAIAVKSGNLNLGGEGQIYAGGFAAAVILSSTNQLPAPVTFLISLTAAMAIPAALAAISALLRHIKGANVLLTSFLISAAIIPFIDGLIAGPFHTKTGNLLATAMIPENVRLPEILPPSPLSFDIIAALLLCILFWYILFKTIAGRHLLIWGTAPEFARYCGYSSQSAVYLPLVASGALHGLAGFFAVTGTYYTCHSGFYSGMGWNALSCALIAYSNPLALIPSGLILSWLCTSADRVALSQNFGFDISALIQGIVLFCISINFISRRRRS